MNVRDGRQTTDRQTDGPVIAYSGRDYVKVSSRSLKIATYIWLHLFTFKPPTEGFH